VIKPDLIRLLIILLIAGSGFLRWVFVKLQEQAAKKRVQDEIECRRAESLRTGRNLEVDITPDPAVERARAETEAAARRQAQIDEFRRRQQERARQRADAQRGSVPFPTEPASAQHPAPARAAPAPRPTPARPVVQRGPRQLLVPSSPEPQATQAQAARPEPKAAQTAARTALGRPQTPEQWRRAIIMNTLLSPAPGLGTGADPWSPVA
jgi:hypothetical protein